MKDFLDIKSNKLILKIGIGVIILILLCGGFFWFISSKAEPKKTAITLDFKQQLKVGESIEVPLFIDTVENTINAAEVYLEYDNNVIRVDEVTKEGTIFKIWVKDMPKFDQEKGLISYAGGIYTPGFQGRGQIGTVKVTMLKNQQTTISFTEKTRVLLNDGKATAVPLDIEPITINPN